MTSANEMWRAEQERADRERQAADAESIRRATERAQAALREAQDRKD